MTKVRINKALAAAGVASRRGAEELIRAGRVKLNGRVVTDLATMVDPADDRLVVDGKRLRINTEHVYYLYHKPRGEVCTLKDELGRRCVGDVVSKLRGNPRPVGRLDRDSEGLLVLTDDGELAQRLTHPRYNVNKLYRVTVAPALRDQDAQRMTKGVELEDGPARFVGVALVEAEAGRSRLEITVDEGRNRLIRRVCEALEYRVLRLKRVRLANLALGRLRLGETRQLSAAEVAALKQQVGLEHGTGGRKK